MQRDLFLIFVSSLLFGVSLASESPNKLEEGQRHQRQLGWYYPAVSPNLPLFSKNPDEESLYTRTLLKRPASYNALQDESAQGRLGLGILSEMLLNSRPVASLNRLPIIRNPNSPGLAQSFDSCKATTGEMGICVPSLACSAFRGKSSGSCNLGAVCCVNVINSCSNQVTLNNTYWEPPTEGISRPTSCTLMVKVDQTLLEQRRPICQIRLDFITFTTEQPNVGDCSKDSFQASGASTMAPQICGDASGQHMYLDVPNSETKASQVLLSFNFDRDSTAVTPTWKIKIALLPCGADYLAPHNCLQYFTQSSGTVKSFNWKNVAEVRQLNNQDYNICFRSETLRDKKTTKLCITPCSDGGNKGFSLSGNAAAALAELKSQTIGESFCNGDFLIIPEGGDGTKVLDRYCGNRLNPGSAVAASATVCVQQPYILSYKTSSIEIAAEINTGFCLDYQQSI